MFCCSNAQWHYSSTKYNFNLLMGTHYMHFLEDNQIIHLMDNIICNSITVFIDTFIYVKSIKFDTKLSMNTLTYTVCDILNPVAPHHIVLLANKSRQHRGEGSWTTQRSESGVFFQD